MRSWYKAGKPLPLPEHKISYSLLAPHTMSSARFQERRLSFVQQREQTISKQTGWPDVSGPFFLRLIFFPTLLFIITVVCLPAIATGQSISEPTRDDPDRPSYFTRRLKLSTAGGIASLALGLAISLHVTEI